MDVNANDFHRSKHQNCFLEGTGKWLLKEPSYEAWANPDSQTKVLWLYGDTGYGKSVLCAHAILLSEKMFENSKSRWAQAAFHFYDYSDEPESPTTAYRNLADSLFPQKYAIDDEVSDKIFKFAGTKASEVVLKGFIEAIAEELEVAFIFLDGLDEVFHDETRKKRALGVLKFCLGLTQKDDTNVKVWCSSQNRDDIRHALMRFPSIHLTEKKNAADIDVLLSDSVSRVLEDNPDFEKNPDFENNPDFEKVVILLDVKKAIKGNFLWASLVTDAINDAGVSTRPNDFIKNLPQDFEKYLEKKIKGIRPSHYELAR
jgi:hypothetical protein